MEIWRYVPDYNSQYQISSNGRIRSFSRISPDGKILKISKCGRNKKYSFVTLCLNSKPKAHYVHRLIAEAFIPNPNNLREVNHINGIKDDNRIENLEWVSSSGNRTHAYDNGLLGHGEKRPGAVFTNIQARKIKELCKTHAPLEIAKMLDIKYNKKIATTIRKIRRGTHYSRA